MPWCASRAHDIGYLCCFAFLEPVLSLDVESNDADGQTSLER